MGQQVSVETLTARDEDTQGKYWASFEPYPHKVGHRKLAYVGILNGSGSRKGDKCLVKALRGCCATYHEWNCEVKIAKTAKEYSSLFSKEMESRNIRTKLIFHTPILAEIDEVSSYMCIALFLGKPKKKMKELEIVSIEPYLEGPFVCFENPRLEYNESIMTSAFSHFTWWYSNGELVICKFKGVLHMNVFRLSVPKIYSRNREFGPSDLGQMGIDNFFANHQCNELCRLWPRPDDRFYKPNLSVTEMELVAFGLKSFPISDKCKDLFPTEIYKSMDRFTLSPVQSTVHCDRHTGCVCRYFRLPCHHRIEPLTPVAYLMNSGYTKERNV